MEEILAEHGGAVQVVYCENDNEAYGALQALSAAGMKAGTDIGNRDVLLISFDATRTGLRYTLYGQIGLNVECSPLYGPDVIALIDRMEASEEIPRRIYQEESQFSSVQDIPRILVGDTVYEIEMLTEEKIAARPY